jgi:hypothetical protein
MFLILTYQLDVDVLCKEDENCCANLWKVLTANNFRLLSEPAEVLDARGLRR